MGSCCPGLWFVLRLKLTGPPLNLLLWTKITHDNMKLYWPTWSSFAIPEFIYMLDWRKDIEQGKNAKHISTGILRSPSIIVNPLLLPSEKLSCFQGFPNWKNPPGLLRALHPDLLCSFPVPLNIHHQALFVTHPSVPPTRTLTPHRRLTILPSCNDSPF